MWFGVIASMKNQQRSTIQSKRMEKTYCTVPNQELSSDSFRKVQLPLAVYAYATTVAVCDSLPAQ